MKKFLALLLALCMVCGLGTALAQETAVNVYALNGPTGIGMAKLMAENDGTYAFTLAGAPDEAVAAVASGSADIAAVPTNLAATLYAKTNGQVQLLALNTLGVLSIITDDASIQSVADLAGKTLYATGQGSTPEYVLNYILAANGLSDQVTVEYKAEHAELATLAAAGEVHLALLPEPHVTSVLSQNSDFRIALDVTELFDQAAELEGQAGAVMSMGCVIVRKAFAQEHPDLVADFLAAYQASIDFVNADPAAAGELVAQQGIMPKAEVAVKAIPNCHMVFVDGAEMKAQIEPFFQILYEANPASVGGALPGEDFYYGAQE